LSIRSTQDFAPEHRRRIEFAKRGTAIGMAVSGSLSASKLVVGWIGHSPAVFADGLENAGDLFGSVKAGLSLGKLRFDHRIGSAALVADAWHDGIEIVSAVVALLALALTLYDPQHFSAADHWGGFGVGLIVLFTALHIVRDTSDELMDAMPNKQRIARIRNVALSEPGVNGVEKIYARKTGLQYHVELHLEVDPQMTVQDSHDLATRTRFLIREQLDWVADVVVHVEPFHGQEPTR
jgi:divalent metal cation (Fe/Co/Zn/Cd) transporter